MKQFLYHADDGHVEPATFYEVHDFPYADYQGYSVSPSKRAEYADLIITFDIEVTTVDNYERPYGFMYVWMMAICRPDDTQVPLAVCGRRWEQWLLFLDELDKVLRLSETGRTAVIYVHYLSYEFQFIKDFLKWKTVFAKESRKVMYATAGPFEFRCSYYLTNKSLERFCKDEEVEHKKLAGHYNYNVLRTPDTELGDVELSYCFCDVVGLAEGIRRKLGDDNLATIPLTSTSYVRRDCRNAVKSNPDNWKWFQRTRLTPELYKMHKEEGRGGNTHGNRYLVGKIIENVRNFDIASSYPFQLLTKDYPSTRFTKIGVITQGAQLDTLIAEKACLFRVVFTELEVRPDVTVPYISFSKAMRHAKEVLFNGRVLFAQVLELTLNEIDWQIITRQYKFKQVAIRDMYIAGKAPLPQELRDVVLEYFRRKTLLKGVDQYNYMKSKNNLNGIFGMAYTDIVREEVAFQDGRWIPADELEKPDIGEVLRKFYKNRNNFLPYSIGPWTTAHARADLQRLIDIAEDAEIYSDTDSCKVYDIDEEAFQALNESIRKVAEEKGAYVDVNGKRVYMGIFDEDPPYKRFRTLGAKKYAYEDQEGKLHITVAGVNPKVGAEYLAEHGGLEAFKPNFIWPAGHSGRTTSWYNDTEIHQITVDGCTFTTASNIGIKNGEYRLGITDEFKENSDVDANMLLTDF